MTEESHDYWVRVRGKFACWTPPEFRAERISALLPSHDAWNGLMRTILGHQEIKYRTLEARILFEPVYFSMKSNELKSDGAQTYDKPLYAGHHKEPRGGNGQFKFVPMTQRTTMMLLNPDYLLRVRMQGERWALEKNMPMFERRMKLGQQWGQPCLGMRELMADLELVTNPNEFTPKPITQDCGIVYYGTDYADPSEPQYFVSLNVVNGVAQYPSWEEVRQYGFRRSTRKAG